MTMSILRAGCSNNQVGKALTTAILSISVIVWSGLIWYVEPPSNFYMGIIGILVAFEIALTISQKAVLRWQALGYINKGKRNDHMSFIVGSFVVVMFMLAGAFFSSGRANTATYIAVGSIVELVLFNELYDSSSPTSPYSLIPVIFIVGLIAFIVISVIRIRQGKFSV
jgi:hypothetical protein